MRTLINIVLGLITLLCINIIIIVGLDISFLKIGEFDNSTLINTILINLSYSFVAGALFYFLVTQLPYIIERKKNKPIIVDIINNISKQLNINIETFDTNEIPNIIETVDKNYLISLINNSELFAVSNLSQRIAPGTQTSNHFIIEQTIENIQEYIQTLKEYKEYLSTEQLSIINKIKHSGYFGVINRTKDTPLDRSLTQHPEFKNSFTDALYDIILNTRSLINSL